MKWIDLLINLAQASSFMPPAVTKTAAEVDNLYSFLLISSFIACAILIGGMIFFVIKYRRTPTNQKSAYISHNTALEFLWSFVPLLIFLFVFAWGWKIYHDMRTMPTNAVEVHARGYQWAWEFTYKNGKKVGNNFKVPVNEPVKLVLSSTDVIHSFYIPSMRIKQDAVPGRFTALTFNAEKVGTFYVFCAEFCGTMHSGMLARMEVVPRKEFDAWLAENDAPMSLLDAGKKLYADKGCVACHSTDGNKGIGPSFAGLFAKTEEMADGQKIKVDENYLRESMLQPNAKTVKGYPPGLMPSFQGSLTEDEIKALNEFIKNQNSPNKI